MTTILLLLAGLGALVLIGLVAWRPLVGVVALVLAVPLVGLGRGTVVPLLRVNELMVLLVVAGALLHYVPRRQRRPVSGLDVAVTGFALGGILIPWMVLFLSGESLDLERWQAVLAPAQYLALYLVFSRIRLSERELRLALNLVMASSIVIGLVAIAELANVPGFRTFVHSYFAPPAGSISTDEAYRPTSLLQHFSAVGAFAVLSFSLALSLATVRHPAFSGKWLGAVMAVNAGAVLASQTYATAAGLAIAAASIVWFGRRVPGQLAAPAVAMLLGLTLFSTQVTGRLQQQFPGSGASLVPESLVTRATYWNEFFLPALTEHLWWGTGTAIPTEVPDELTGFVDNEYLLQGLRAGVPGILLLLIMLATIGFVAWQHRASPDPWLRTLGAVCLASVLTFAVMGTTAEYLTFVGVAQPFWMMVGLLSGRIWELERSSTLQASMRRFSVPPPRDVVPA